MSEAATGHRRPRIQFVAIGMAVLLTHGAAFGTILPRLTREQSRNYRARHPVVVRRSLGQEFPGFGVGNLPNKPLTGTIRGVCLLIRFPDAMPEPEHSILFYNNLFAGGSNPESMQAYFREQSHGLINFTVDTFGWFTVEDPQTLQILPKAFFDGGVMMEVPPMSTLLERAIKTADPVVDFSRYDSDNDGIIDYLCLAHASRDSYTDPVQKLLDFDGAGPFATSFSYASRMLNDPSIVPYETDDGVDVDSYIIIDESVTTRIGILAHETGHVFGLPDMYNNDPFSPQANGDGVGIWSLMCRGVVTEDRAYPLGVQALQPASQGFPGIPLHLDPWSKIQFGWLSSTRGEIKVVSESMPAQRVYSIEINPIVYELFPNGDAGSKEYFLVERRGPNGFDALLPGSGLLIWHIDDAVISERYPTNEIMLDTSRKGLDVEEADGLREIDQSVFTTDPVNFMPIGFAQGNLGDEADLFPGTTNNRRFVPSDDLVLPTDPMPEPNSDDNGGRTTGVKVENITDDPSQNVTVADFSVSGRAFPPKMTLLEPKPNEDVATITPTIRAAYDNGNPNDPGVNPLDPSSVDILIDGSEYVSNGTVNPQFGGALEDISGGSIIYKPPALSVGRHRVEVRGNDELSRGTEPPVVTTGAVSFTISDKILPSGVQMFSVPLWLTMSGCRQPYDISQCGNNDVLSAGPQAVLQNSSPTFARYATSEAKYHRFQAVPPPTSRSLDPYVDMIFAGLAYWTKLGASVALRLEGESVPTVESFTIYQEDSPDGTLPAGWRMIGNPFNFAVDFAALQVEYRGQVLQIRDAIAYKPPIIANGLFTWTGARYESMSVDNGVLQPFAGYWVKLLQPAKLMVPPLESARRGAYAKQAKATKAGQTGFQLEIAARIAEEDQGSSIIGAAREAADGSDNSDRMAPPPPPTAMVQVALPHRDWGVLSGDYGVDLRAYPLTSRQSYEIEVTSFAKRTPVTLLWRDLTQIPHGLRLTLVDVDGGKSLYMRTTSSYTYDPGDGGVRRFRLVVDPGPGALMRVVALRASWDPLRHGLVYDYVLTKAAHVKVRILTPAGRVVREISAAAALAGLNRGLWDGRDRNGRSVSRGLYLVELVASTDEHQVGRAVRTFRVGR